MSFKGYGDCQRTTEVIDKGNAQLEGKGGDILGRFKYFSRAFGMCGVERIREEREVVVEHVYGVQ